MTSRTIDKLPIFFAAGFYPAAAIPRNKLNNAMESYPIPRDETIYGLVDATVFGSAKNGMVFASTGIYWRNDWTTPSPKHYLSWDDLKLMSKNILQKGNKLFLPFGCIFDMAGSSVKPDNLKEFLLRILEEMPELDAQPLEKKVDIQHLAVNIDSALDAAQQNIAPSDQIEIKEKTATDNTFKGSYNQIELALLKQIAKRFRLCSRIYIAPAISVQRVKTIRRICGEEIDPYSILVIVDNTFLGTCKDFMIVTNRELIAKATMSQVERFPLNEIRQIRCDDAERIFINNFTFQQFDQLSNSETLILVDFLREFIPALRDLHTEDDTQDSSENPFELIIEHGIIHAKKKISELLGERNNPRLIKLVEDILDINGEIFIYCLNTLDESIACEEDYIFHQLLLSHSAAIAFAFNEVTRLSEEKTIYGIFGAASGGFIEGIAEGAARCDVYLKYDEAGYMNIFECIMEQSAAGDSFAKAVERFDDETSEFRNSMLLAKRVIPYVSEYLDEKL